MHKKIYDVKSSIFAIPPKHLSCYLNSTPVNAANQRLSGVLFDLKSISYQVSPVFLSKVPEYFLCFFFLNFPLKYAYTLPYPPFRKYIFYRIFFVCSCDIARKCLLEFCFICLSYLLQLGLHLSPTRCLLVYTELFAWPDVKSSKLL